EHGSHPALRGLRIAANPLSHFTNSPPTSVPAAGPPIKSAGCSACDGGAAMDLPTGELVVRNGKRKGARLPLRAPVTVIGSADGCDVRLAADGLGPVHCAVVLAPDGPAL